MILREMFSALTSHSTWIHTVSNWALGTTGVYVGLIVANIDKLEPHLSKGWQGPVFWCAVISAITGIGIQIASGVIQFALPIENRMFSLTQSILQDPAKFGISPQMTSDEFKQIIINPVVDEFIKSRPEAWGELAKWAKKQSEIDAVFLSKNTASWTQEMFAALVFQYISLGVAIFWPLALVH